MTSTLTALAPIRPATVTTAPPPSPIPGYILRGRYGGPLRSAKGKVKGLILHVANGDLAIKLPKYLRPMLVRDLAPGAWVQVWAYRKDNRWRGMNLIPWPETEVPQVLKEAVVQPTTVATKLELEKPSSAPKASTKPACIQVCRKGKCFRQGGQHILQALQAEVERNPDLQHITVEGTGCMGACKQGPNLRVMPQKKLHSRITPDRALDVLTHCQ